MSKGHGKSVSQGAGSKGERCVTLSIDAAVVISVQAMTQKVRKLRIWESR